MAAGPVAQTPLLSWRGEDVSLKDVVNELHRLEGELAHSEAAEAAEQPRPRTSSMNMIAISWDAPSSARAARVLDGIAVHHPSRVVILELGDAESPARLDADVLLGARELSPGLYFPFERILLKVNGEAADHVANLVEPFLQPDLPTHVWWMGDPPLQKRRLLDAVPMCSTLLVDSSAFQRPFDTFIRFSDLVTGLPREIGVEDLHWARLHPWRELLAQFFAPPETHNLLNSIRGVAVQYAGEGRGNRVPAALLVGWLASSLHWEVKRAIGGPDGKMLARFSARDGSDVEVGCQARGAAELQEGDICAVRLHAQGGGAEASIIAERDRENPHHVHVQMSVEGKKIENVMPLRSEEEPELLVRALKLAGRDAVYLRSLRVAGELMKSLE